MFATTRYAAIATPLLPNVGDSTCSRGSLKSGTLPELRKNSVLHVMLYLNRVYGPLDTKWLPDRETGLARQW